MVGCTIIASHWQCGFYLDTCVDPLKESFPKEDKKLRDIEASRMTILRFFVVDSVEFSQYFPLI